MKVVIDIPNSLYANIKKIKYGSIASKRLLDCVKNGIPLESVLEDIKREIAKPLREERFFDTGNAKAQTIALNWCIDIINKHMRGVKDEIN